MGVHPLDCSVMLKILEINRNADNQNKLYKDIVTYTNSQNAIKESTFVATRYKSLNAFILDKLSYP